jgi:hypothetical protein
MKTPTGVLLLVTFLFSAAAGADGDAATLLKLHDKVMRAHLQSNVGMLLEDEVTDYLLVSRGEISRPSPDERRAALGPYLERTTLESYADLVPPIVTVSSDGTLGWVAVQVEAKGVQKNDAGGNDPLQFVCAWIELYEKRDGKWLRVGNVSNFKS